MDIKAKEKIQNKRRASYESILAFKKELKALAFEPIYGESIKEIAAKLTSKIEKLAEEYGYDVMFSEKSEVEIEGDIYYFDYVIRVKTKNAEIKKLKIRVQYIMYDQNYWMGLITEVK